MYFHSGNIEVLGSCNHLTHVNFAGCNGSSDSSDDDSTTYIIVGVVVGVVAVVGVIAAVTMLAGSGSGAAVSTASTVQMS